MEGFDRLPGVAVEPHWNVFRIPLGPRLGVAVLGHFPIRAGDRAAVAQGGARSQCAALEDGFLRVAQKECSAFSDVLDERGQCRSPGAEPRGDALKMLGCSRAELGAVVVDGANPVFL